MAEFTDRIKLPYPSEDTEDWFALFETMMDRMDSFMRSTQWRHRLFTTGGGNVAWTGGVLSWDAPFYFIQPNGARVRVPADSLEVADGEFVQIGMTTDPPLEFEGSLFTDSKISIDQGNTLVAQRSGSDLWFSTNQMLADGESFTDGIGATLPQSVLTSVGYTPEAGEEGMISGVHFEWIDATSAKLVPSDIDSRARVPVFNGATRVNSEVAVELTWDITTTGINGLLLTTEAADTGYDIYLATYVDGSNAALFGAVSGTSWAAVLAALPAPYTHLSSVLWFVRNNAAGDIVEFKDIGGGECRYVEAEGSVLFTGDPYGLRVVTSFVSTTSTAIDFTNYIPDSSAVVLFAVTARNNSGSASQYNVGTDSTTLAEGKWLAQVGPNAGDTRMSTVQLSIPIAATIADSAYHKWSIAPGGSSPGGFVDVQGWKLNRVQG